MPTVVADSSRGSAVLAPRYQARRTKAAPKQTLFGSNIETVKNTESLRELLANAEPMKEGSARRYTPCLPDYLKDRIPERKDLNVVKEDYLKMKAAVAKTSKDLISTQRDALFFNAPSKSKLDNTLVSAAKNDSLWYSKGDLANSQDINCLGLNNHESYNHDKYGKKASSDHKYKLIGDVLQPPMNGTAVPHRRASLDNPSNTNRQKNRNNNNDGKTEACKCPVPETVCGNDRCFTCLRPRLNPDILTRNLQKTYDGLGNTQRRNVFPGYSLYQHESMTHASHSDDVYLKRDAPTDQFRCTKDAYSVWAEANLVREKLKKEWIQAEARKKAS